MLVELWSLKQVELWPKCGYT